MQHIGGGEGGSGHCCCSCNYHHYHSTVIIISIIIMCIILKCFISTVYTKQQKIHIFSLNITSILHTNSILHTKQHILATDSSHRQGDHKKSNCLRLHWWLVISNITNVLFCNIYDMQCILHH
jgi:hypothetical protein